MYLPYLFFFATEFTVFSETPQRKSLINILQRMAKLVVPIVAALLVSFQNYSQRKNVNDDKSLFEINTEPISGLTQWKNMKFGMFIHWGVYSIPAGIWKGKQIEKLGEQIMRHADISIEDYENIARQFNPVKFDAEEIVKLAKSTGMKYIVFTAKHHDGFSMFDSKFTDYDIVDFTPVSYTHLRAHET